MSDNRETINIDGVELPVNDVYQLPKIASLQGRIRYYATFEDGWLDGKGKKADAERLAELCRLFASHYPSELPDPFFNTSDDGDGVEFDISWEGCDDWHARMDVNIQWMSADWIDFNKDGMDDAERTLNLRDSADWAWLSERIRRRMGGAK